MRKFFWLLGVPCMVAMAAFYSVDIFAAPLKIRLAYPTRSMSLLHVQVAMEKGLFAKHGLDVEAIQIRSAVSLPALLSNEIQYMTSIGTGIRAAAKGLPIKVVLISRDSPLFFVVSRVKTIPELRGKKIGVGGNPGSSTEVVTRLVLEHHGLQLGRDYAFVYGGDTASVFAKFRAGIFDTISISLPFPILAEKEGANVLAKSSDVIRMASTGLAVRSPAINEQKQEIKQMIRADNEAREFIHRNKAETVRIIGRWLEMDPVTAARSYDLSLDSFRRGALFKPGEIQAAVDIEGIKPEVPLERMYDISLAQEVAKEGAR
jgi:ABC-type nitrate/sulfonate/bicarbonate transport system substrate-binding protein